MAAGTGIITTIAGTGEPGPPYANDSALLKDGGRHRHQPAESCREHGQHRKSHPHDDALDGDVPGSPRDHDRLADTIEPVGENNHIR